MRVCYLHIGMHKTGSTAIQTALDGYDDGATTYLKLALTNHSAEIFTAFSERRGTILMRELPKSASPDVLAAAIRAKMLAQITAHRKNLVISGEEMSAQFGQAEVSALRSFLEPHFDRLQVIVYVREPGSMMRSVMQEQIKNGLTTFDIAQFYPNYRTRLAPWHDTFGDEGMNFVPFDPKAFPKGSVIADFARRVGITVSHADGRRANESLSAEACAIRFLQNHQRSAYDRLPFGGRLRMMRENLAVTDFGSTPLDLDTISRSRIIAENKDDIDWIEARLGGSLPEARPVKGAVIFESEPQILNFAAALEPSFRQWVEATMPISKRVRALSRVLRGRGLQ